MKFLAAPIALRNIPLHTWWLLVSLSIFVGIASISYQSVDAVGTTSAEVDQTHRALSDLERVLSNLKDAESGQRGFLATSDQRFLEPYNAALRALPESLEALEGSLSDHMRQQNALVALGNNVRLRVRILSIPIEMRRMAKGPLSPDVLEIMTYGKHVMDDIRAQIAAMQGQEEAILARRSALERASASQTKQLIVIGNLCASALLITSFYLMRRENQRRRSAEQTAHQRAKEIQDLYDHAPCGYHSCDENAVFLNINETELRWLGYSREEVIGRMALPDVLTEKSRPQFFEDFKRYKEQGYINDVELEMQRKDGSTFFAATSAVAIKDQSGKYVASRSTLFDVTERRRAREEIERLNEMLGSRAAELEAANKELESFSYTVSHDLRAPLRAINGFATILAEDFTHVLNDEGKRLLAVIRDSARRMGDLIDDLLAFSQLGRAQIQVTPVDMNNLIRECLSDLELSEGPRNAKVDIADLPAAFGDRTLLRQVCNNLLQNALKYSSRSEQPRVEVNGEIRQDEIVYWIKDNGIGFNMQFHHKLFGVFQRLHEGIEYPGTGVGLAIVQRVVERHGGRVWAIGEPGKGATFFFSLPRAK
ncbi:MAG TPA: CHASE3 domain-containing protein [Burkholderiales bacterium]|nr:CHASE3 domain-containing protein [Burkholderiales bacterium]